jgi:uncharacterized protein (DUF2249 family)/hemerythrin-like domain-containing protein
MTDVFIASTEADARAAEGVERHHEQMARTLATHAEAMVDALTRAADDEVERSRAQVARWCAEELLPHAVAEEQALYPEARRTTEGRLLVDGMIAEHAVITRLVRDVSSNHLGAVRAVALVSALRVLFDTHVAKENELVLPLLQRLPGVAVAELLGGMHELLGAGAESGDVDRDEGCGSGHSCSCGETDPGDFPELDVRSIPHAIRHATVFAALDALGPGGGLVLVAHHQPEPLLGELEQRFPGTWEVDYLERGPEVWRLRLVHRETS